MNTIYNSLERNNTDGLESHHIQAICEYVQNHLVPTVACEASRVLLQMVVFAKGGPVTKMIEKIYLCILADSVVEMEEYSILGECLVKLLELYRSCGSETFKGCQLELPFGNVACQPPKFLIAIRSLRSVVDLVNFWNSVTQSLYQDTGMILPLQRQHNAVLSTLVDFSRLLSNIDATAPMVVALCQAIVSIVSHCSSAGSTVFYPGEQYAPAAMPASLIINGLISWVDYALSCTVKMIAQIGQVAGVTVQTYRPAEVKVAMLRQMHRAMDHILAVVATCVQYPLKNDAIAVVEGKKLVQRIFEVLEAVPKQKELSNACIVKLLGFESMCSSKVALQNNCAAAQSSVAPSSSFMVSSSGKSPAPMRSSGLVLQSTATSTSGSPRRAAAAPSNSPTPTASAESMLSNIAAQLVQIAYVLQTAFALDVPPLEVYQRLCVDLLTTHAVLRAFSLHIHRSPDICAGLCDAWCASSSENALVSSSGMPVDGSGEWQRSESLVEPECKAQRFTPVTPVDSAGKTVASSRTLATSDEGVDASLDLVSLARSSSSRVVRELLSLSQLPEPGDGDADDAKDCLAALVQVMIPFEALMTAVLVVPRNTYSTPPTGTLSQKILRRFLRLFGQFIVPSVGTAVDTADRLTASWALLQCASRLSDASSYDNLIRLLPSAVWRILGCALEATRATMVGFAQAAVNSSSYSASRLSTTATSTSSHNLGGATSTANTPRARQSLQTVQEGGSSSSLNAYAGDNANANGDASLDASQLEELLTDVLSLDVNETELPSSRLPVRCMEDSIENYVLVWLKVAALQVPPGMAAIDNSSSAASSSAGADSSVAAGSKRSRAPGQGQMPGQVQLQDADSFDFFADQDSGAEDNSAGGTRKRLKKKSDSFVPVSGANKSVTSRASAFGLLVQNEAFLSAFELHGSAVIVLIRRLSQQDDVSSEVLTTAVEYVTQAVTRYLMDGTTISVALESALTLLFVMVMLFLVKSGREQVGSLHAVYQFSDVVRHLLQPGERLSLPAVLDQPENAVFLAQFYASVASRRIAVVESALTSTTAPPSSSTATAADNSVSALAASAVKLLQALAPHWEHVANLLLSSDRRASSRFATTTGGADGDGEGDGSEFPESESAMDVEEDSSPPAAGESTSGGGGSGGKGTAGRVHVEFLLLHRSLIAVVIISRQAVAVSVSPAPLIEMVQNQDASLQKLIAHRVRAHAVMLRLSQCLTVGMIAHLTSKSRGELGRSSKAPARLSENALVRTAISLLDVPYSERNPACKIVTVGMLRFVKYAALLAAEEAVWVLKEVCLARASTGDALDSDEFSVELLELSRGGVLATLLVSNLSTVTDELLLPLCLAAAAPGASDDDVELVETLLHALDHYTAVFNSDKSLLDAARARIFSKLAHASDSTASKTVVRLMRERKLDIQVPSRFLLDDNPSVFHELLLTLPSAELQVATASELLQQGRLSGALTNGATLFGVYVSEPMDASCMSSTTFHQALLPVVWSLGCAGTSGSNSGNSTSSLSSSSGAVNVRAMEVLCVLARERAWRQSSRTSVAAALSDQEIKGVVSDKLQSDFLFIMANLLLKDWAFQTQAYQKQSLSCFRALVNLLKQSDLIKFLPKILIVVDSALGGPSAKVRLAAVQLTAALYPRLPVDVLGEHLASIVVPLFPLLEVSSSSSAVDAKPVVAVAARRPPLPAQTSESALSASTQAVSLRRTVTAATTVAVSSSSVLTISNINASPGCQDAEAETETELAGADLHAFGTLGRPFAPNFAPGESDLLSRVLDVMFAANKGRQWAAETQRLAVGIIKHLFIDMRENIQKYIQSVAYIPNVPELKTVFDLHQQEVRGLSLEQSLRLLCDMLSHASAHVRYVAVNRLTIACRENKEQLHRVLESTTNSSATTATEHIVSMMLQSLLRLCAHEQDGRVQAACARCFGELGAVDPSRVRVRLGKPPALPATEGKSGGDSAAFPWHVKLHDFGLYLLEHHLVPGLRSADRSATQDKSGFAIQGILRCISATYNEGEDVAAGGDEFVPSSTSMPEKLKDVLAAKSILDVTEPFWSTSYTIPETYNLRKPPLYFHGLPFMRWISLFTRFLIYKARGPLSPIFMACRGLIRLRTELCQYLLPHLIYDVLTQSGADQQQVDAPTRTLSTATNASAASATSVTSRAAAPRPAVDMVIEEVCLVLRGSSSSEAGNSQGTATSSMNTDSGASQSDQMCIQSIFSLFDTLSGWVTRCTQKSGYCFPRSPFQRGPSVYGCRSYEMEKNGIACVKAFLDAVPRDLLSKAALSIKAHTRALRYMEIHSREVQRQQHFYGVQLCAEGFLDYEALFKKCETDFAVKWRAADVSTTRSSAEFQKITILCGDHAGGELPILSAAQLESYTSIFTNLEDPDSLQGALVVSQIHGHPSNMWHRILELELTDDWLGALLEYGFVHNSQRFSNSLHHYIRRSAAQKAAAIAASGAAANATVGAAVGAVSVKVEHGSAMVVEGAEVELEQHQEQEQAGEGGELMSLDEVVELERRKLRCMVELGHFEAVIDQTTAMAGRISELEKALLPLGTEAAWRLMRWDDLDAFLGKYKSSSPADQAAQSTSTSTPTTLSLPVLDADRFQLSVGKLLLCLQKQDRGGFDTELEKARTQTMSSLSAASMESYGRAYPMLTRLHALHELECGYDLLLHPKGENGSGGGGGSSTTTTASASAALREKHLQSLRWEDRLKYMSPSVPQRSTLLAVRRCILGVCEMPSLVAQNWLELSHSMRQLGKFDAARMAVRNAEAYGLDSESVLLQECRILRDSGEVSRALMMLEPVELDLSGIKPLIKNATKRGGVLPQYLDTEQKRVTLAKRISLATQLMVDSRQKQGQIIVQRYNAVIALHKMWPQAYFDLAKYHEFLYHDYKTKLQQSLVDFYAQSEAGVLAAAGGGSAGSKAATSAVQRQHQLLHDTQVLCSSLINALEMFGNTIILSADLAMQVLPRMLTLWLSFTAEQDLLAEGTSAGAVGAGGAATGGVSSTARRTDGTTAILLKAQGETNECMGKICEAVPASTWYMCMSQLVSRVLHRNEGTVNLLVTILLKILGSFPKQGIWHIAALMFSFNSDRKKVAKKLLQDTYKALQAVKSPDAQMLVDSQKVCQNLVNLAAHQCKERKIRWASVPGVKLDNFLVPTQAVLHHTNPLRMLELKNGNSANGGGGGSSYYSTDHMFISSFNENVDVASSKAKPKTISLLTVCGKTVRFLCKQEKDGDLRKDARLMEFNTAVNRLLLDDPDGRKRHLRLRTYAVVCLNEECGILEWVNNTDCLRQVIHKSHTYWPDFYPPLSYKDVFEDFVEIQTKHEDDIPKMVHYYARLLAQHNYHPCFHRWFLEQFPDPTAWQEARTNFVRSAAVWSAVGHVIGLGDRHTENILLDLTNGEMVHVDFDCIFDKGLSLNRPEIVPFRLTPNIVDAMGVTGVEGTFRRTMEVTLSVLRENKDILLSVLEPFLRDPTVSWSRSGRAQRNTDGSTTSTTTAGAAKGRDHENKEAKEMLQKISERLNGMYNIVHPHRDKFMRGASKRGEPTPVRGIGVAKSEILPLSVQGQVQRMIDEATAPENLVQMYIGWQPWV